MRTRPFILVIALFPMGIAAQEQEPIEDIKSLRAEISALREALSKTENKLAAIEARMTFPQKEEAPQLKNTAVNQAPNPLSFTAKSYIGYRYDLGVPVLNTFDIYRGYFGFSYRINPRLTFSATMDTAAKRDDKGYFEVVLKNLYLDFEYLKDHHLQFGQTNLSWVPYMEDLVGDRYIQKSFTEEEGYNTSTDMGIMLKGSFIRNRIQYQAGLVNGNGWHGPETNRYKDTHGRLTFSPFAQSKGWHKGIFASMGASKKFYDRSEIQANGQTMASRLHFLAGYQSAAAIIGLEILKTSDPTSKVLATQPSAVSLINARGEGYSAFINTRPGIFLNDIPKNGGLLLRLDRHDPTKGNRSSDSHIRIMIGPTWTANKNFQFFVGYLGTRYDKDAKVRKFSTNLLVFSAETKF